jgi:flagellar biosynthesis protein FliP
MKSFYDYLTIISSILYILVLFGVFTFAPDYLIYVTSFIKIYISIILLYKFNPLHKSIHITNDDKKIIFTSGIYLLLTTALGEYLIAYKNKLEDKVKTFIS